MQLPVIITYHVFIVWETCLSCLSHLHQILSETICIYIHVSVCSVHILFLCFYRKCFQFSAHRDIDYGGSNLAESSVLFFCLLQLDKCTKNCTCSHFSVLPKWYDRRYGLGTSKLMDYPYSHIKRNSVMKLCWANLPYV